MSTPSDFLKYYFEDMVSKSGECKYCGKLAQIFCIHTPEDDDAEFFCPSCFVWDEEKWEKEISNLTYNVVDFLEVGEDDPTIEVFVWDVEALMWEWANALSGL